MPTRNEQPIDEATAECRLCGHSGVFKRLISPLGSYYRLCENCKLIFVESQYLPDPEVEKQRYLTHQNSPTIPGYVQFLSQAVTPTLPFLKKGMSGLDFGCGPGPALRTILKKEGLDCSNYDPIFFPGLPEKQFDFIFATETLEHFRDPRIEMKRIHALLKPCGVFTLMTEFWTDKIPFSTWYYAKDFTHISFYHQETIRTICDWLGFELLFSDHSRIAILRKK